MPLDTHRAFKRLQEDDVFTAEQAERITEMLADRDVASATKEDLDDLEGRLTDRIDQISTRIDQSEEWLDGRIDQLEERFDHVDERMEAMEERLTQQGELSKERLNRRIDEAEKRLLRWMIVGLSTVTALPGILISVVGL
jgi:gas vesicle protein